MGESDTDSLKGEQYEAMVIMAILTMITMTMNGNCPGICHDSSGVGTDDDAIVDGVDGLNADDQVGNLVILNLFLALLLSSFSDMGGGKSDMKEIIANLFSKTNTNNLEYSCKCFCLKYLFNLVRLLGVG